MKKSVFAWDKDFAIALSVSFVSIVGVVSIAPSLPQITTVFSLTKQEAGQVLIFYTFPGIFLTPLAGVLADRLGRRRVLIVALIANGVIGFLTGLSRTLSLILLLRFLQGISGAALVALSATIIGDMFRGEGRQKAMSINIAVINLAAMVFLASAGFLAHFGWHYPLFLSLVSLPVALAAFSLKTPEPQMVHTVATYFKKAMKILKSLRAIGIYTATTVMFALLYGGLITFYSHYLTETFSAPAYAVGIILASLNLVAGAASLLVNTLRKYASEARLVQLSFLPVAVGFALILSMPTLWSGLFPMALAGVGFGVFYVIALVIVTSLATTEERGVVTAINTSMIALGQTLGPLAAGFVFAKAGLTGVFYAAAILGIVEFFFALVSVRDGHNTG